MLNVYEINNKTGLLGLSLWCQFGWLFIHFKDQDWGKCLLNIVSAKNIIFGQSVKMRSFNFKMSLALTRNS